MSTRRGFVKRALAGSSLIALGRTVPGFLARTARAAAAEKDARVLVVIQLDGGNDGINTVVPYADDGYARHRKALRLARETLLKVDDQVALHPSLRDAAALLESGRLAIVPGVGYPNPNRSHFASMATWHTARLEPADGNGLGWIGRALDSASAGEERASSLYAGPGTEPVALRGRRSITSVLERLDELTLDRALAGTTAPTVASESGGDGLAEFVRQSTLDAYASAEQVIALETAPRKAGRYPDVPLAGRLQIIARLLKAGHPARAYYTVQPGYDTHAGQIPTHAGLLLELGSSLRAFLDDLAACGLAERVLVLAFSEFGRRVAENSSLGTDHGTAGPVLLAGPGVQPGRFGRYPSLTDLVDGDLRMTIDFRSVYATLLSRWLSLPAEPVLGAKFELLDLVKT
jgi:uncharacterized protein (DUF1501 family)